MPSSAEEEAVSPPPTGPSTGPSADAARSRGENVAAPAVAAATAGGGVVATATRCQGCHREFASRNAVFKHLVDTQGACLDKSELDEFRRHVLNQRRIKVLLLVGYAVEAVDDEVRNGDDEEGLGEPAKSDSNHNNNSNSRRPGRMRVRIRGGDDAAQVLQDALVRHLDVDPSDASTAWNDLRLIRAYGHACRGTDAAAQDPQTGALTEVLAVRLPPLLASQSVQAWIDAVNQVIETVLREGSSTAALQVLGRLDLPASAHKFNPEMDFSHRRVEFLVPVDFFWPPPERHRQALMGEGDFKGTSLRDFFTQIFSFDDGANPDVDDDNDEEEGKDGPGGGKSSQGAPVHYSRTDEALLGVSRPSKEVLLYMHSLKKKMQRLTTQVEKLDVADASARLAKQHSQLKRQNNRTFQEQTRQAKKQNSKNKRPKKERNDDASSNNNGGKQIVLTIEENGTAMNDEAQLEDAAPTNGSHSNGNASPEKRQRNRGNKGTHVLRRKRFHNFTPFVMAHEFLAFRRLDRFYHRASLRFQPDVNSGPGRLRLMSSSSKDTGVRPFFLLSLSGDLFLTGQAPRIVGLFLAMATGAIDDDIVDCVFDENYPHLVPTPPAPLFAMCAGDAFFTKWEGKLKTILTPRPADHFTAGWNDPATLRRVREWTVFLRERTAQAWVRGGIVGAGDDRLALVRHWVDDVLQPWAVRAREQLKDYRQWAAVSQGAGNSENSVAAVESNAAVIEAAPASSVPVGTASLPPLELVDSTVPQLYEKVLFYLRQADASGLWPSTTPKRQLVMISTVKEGHKDHGDPATASSLAQALERAQSSQAPDSESRASAYIFEEGQGGASGSFSVGAMPDGQSAQPRANTVFPQLMKAAFELELALRPDREPSSTIAINRNAQFRPHTDSGAGAGQSTSLIVGLGTYAGGELVVEGEMVDIRYKAREFNGWKQRHWTMPFVGERYSLVWFTPKGCEGVRGIDLCKDIVLE